VTTHIFIHHSEQVTLERISFVKGFCDVTRIPSTTYRDELQNRRTFHKFFKHFRVNCYNADVDDNVVDDFDVVRGGFFKNPLSDPFCFHSSLLAQCLLENSAQLNFSFFKFAFLPNFGEFLKIIWHQIKMHLN
jgi:hypothetical protein